MNQLDRLKLYIDPEKVWTEAEDVQLEMLLDFAGVKILNARYPYGTTVTEVPAMYRPLQVRVAVDLYSHMGAEGELAHSENGISRTWESADVAQSMLREVVPMIGGIASANTSQE